MSPTLIAAVAVTMCGIHVSVPDGWKASIASNTNTEVVECKAEIDPPHWPTPGKSRWGAPDHPLGIKVFLRKAARDAVFEEMSFFTDEEGEVTVPGFRSVMEKAEPFRMGRLRGFQATPFGRGYIRDESLLRGDESRVYSSSTWLIVAKTREGRWVGIECDGGTPDEVVGCDAAVPLLAKTSRFGK
ncbi:MAG TPA: hypothetical protein VI670_03745 [Thermoanaerobaculia bacterium]|jgi:hypothetical protein